MSNRLASKLSFTRKVALAVFGMTALAMPVVVGVVNAPAIRAQSEAASATRFEVASIKPCAGEALSRGGSGNPSPGTLEIDCWSVRTLVRSAFIEFANGHYNPAGRAGSMEPIVGGPTWLDSGRYSIHAKAATPAGRQMVMGPMLQALLEERFKLQVHREVREVPVFELTVAKGGPKLQRFDGSCTNPTDLTKPPPIPAPPKGTEGCRNIGGVSGTNLTRHWRGISLLTV